MRLRAEMPGAVPRRPRGWRIGQLGLFAVGVFAGILAARAWGTGDPVPLAELETALEVMVCVIVVLSLFWRVRFRFSLAARALLTCGLSFFPIALLSMGERRRGPPRFDAVDAEATFFMLLALWSLVFAVALIIDDLVGRWRRASDTVDE